MFKGFKEFLLRGNVVDLAVAVVVGSAFNTVVQSFVANFLMPLIAAIGGKPSFDNYLFSLSHSTIFYGKFLTSLVSFIIIAAVVYFLVVAPINRLIHLMNRDKNTDDPTTRKCPECLSEIPLEASRCKFCTASVKPGKLPAQA